MPGLLDVGESYKSKAMSGFIQQSSDQQRVNKENKDLEAQQQEQTTRNVTSGVSAAASIGMMLWMLA